MKPVLPLGLMGMAVFIDWKWDGLAGQVDALEIQVDRGAGFGFLTIDTNPGYLDTAPFPATPAMWKYRAIFRKGDQTVGLLSAVEQIAVG